MRDTVAIHADYAACSGCSLCRLVCPMWRARRDPRFSPEGLAKGLLHGATAEQLTEPAAACALCGACDAVCPERIDLSGLVMELRQRLPRPPQLAALHATLAQQEDLAEAPAAGALLLPGADLRANPPLRARVETLLGVRGSDDDGADIALALEAGVEISAARRRRFLDRIGGRSLVVGDGLLLRQLRHWLPAARLQSLGEALSTLVAVRRRLTSADFYVIEARAYHADYQRLVTYYDALRAQTGCMLNLDLQRIAMPAMAQGVSRQFAPPDETDLAQASWMLQGRQPRRIVVESLAERAVFAAISELPVLHVAELTAD